MLTILPGASIGYHKHDVNEDSYTVVSGVGVFKQYDRHPHGSDARHFYNGKEPLVMRRLSRHSNRHFG